MKCDDSTVYGVQNSMCKTCS